MSGIPPWANVELCTKIPEWRKQGEGATLEFKEDFPEQGHTLAREVAAFATSGGGTILIGVHNNGEVSGLAASTEDDRDALVHRAQNIVRTIKPQVKYQTGLASDEGKLILVIAIAADQGEPVFYYQERPYIRDGRESRPAEPNEVKERVWAHPSAEYAKKMQELKYESSRAFVEASKSRFSR